MEDKQMNTNEPGSVQEVDNIQEFLKEQRMQVVQEPEISFVPMSKDALKVFMDNYNNKGMCEPLPDMLKNFEKKFKGNPSKGIEEKIQIIHYYPWAVIERVFRQQGGRIEVLDWVHPIEMKTLDLVPNNEGVLEMKEVTSSALFIKLKATWMGVEEIEFYPLFNNQNAKVIKTPTAMDLNTSRQRGMVRLIARISGIGLDIFEQQDSQFEGEESIENLGDKTTIKVKDKEEGTPKEEPKKPKPKPKKETKKTTKSKKAKDKQQQDNAMESMLSEEVKEEPKVEVKEVVEEEVVEDNSFLKGFLQGESVEEEEQKEVVAEINKTQSDFIKEDFASDTQEFAEKLLEVKKKIRDTGKRVEAKQFVTNQGKELLNQLTYVEMVSLIGFLDR